MFLALANSSHYQQLRSNSVNVKHLLNAQSKAATSSTNASYYQQLNPIVNSLNHTSLSNRKPSFKFESNILNRVQNMNLSNNTAALNNKQHATPSSKSSSHASLNSNLNTEIEQHQGEDVFYTNPRNIFEKKIQQNNTSSGMVMRMPSINKSNINIVRTNNQGNNSLHQISLDSGIYLPSD